MSTPGGNVGFAMNHPMHPQQLALGIDTLTHSSPAGMRLATKNSDFKRTSTAQIAWQKRKKGINLVTKSHSADGEGPGAVLFV